LNYSPSKCTLFLHRQGELRFRTLGFAAGPVIAGRIFDRSGSYTGAWFTFIAMEIVSMFAMLATLPVADEKARIDNGRTVGAEPVTLR
jgi:hypothetical protein